MSPTPPFNPPAKAGTKQNRLFMSDRPLKIGTQQFMSWPFYTDLWVKHASIHRQKIKQWSNVKSTPFIKYKD